MKLVEITYYRDENIDVLKSAVVTEKQAKDIKAILPWLHIVNIKPSCVNKKRDYILH